MSKHILCAILTALAVTSVHAQKKVPAAVKPAVVEKTPAQLLYESMLPATARVLFVDSTVVDKEDFLSSIPLNKEAGTLHRVNDFFNIRTQGGSALYVNDFENQCFFSEADGSGDRRLRTVFKMGGQWSEPQDLAGIGKEYQQPNYPVMSTDGLTLFFAAKGEHSVGGYDIFVTRYDSENGRFYEPQNYGLPFNSTANDYLLAISEADTLGWLVTDRYQPEGKVCVYTFVPTPSRLNYEESGISDEKLARFARIASIEDTWTDPRELARATRRVEKMKERARQSTGDTGIHFVINDKTTYHSVSDFHSPESARLYAQLQEIRQTIPATEQQLEDLRARFHTTSVSNRQAITPSILKLEKDISQLRTDAHNLEKQIRNIENQ